MQYIDCYINPISRQVSYPSAVIVQRDTNVEVLRFHFALAAQYELENDSIRVMVMSGKETRGFNAENVRTETNDGGDEELVFEHTITRYETEKPGQINVSVCGNKISGDTITEAWHTLNMAFQVSGAIHTDSDEGEDSEETAASNAEKIAALQTLVDAITSGRPIPVDLKSKMVDTSAIYLYTGNETGEQHNYWYYHDGTSWVPGSEYGGITVDDELSATSENPVQNKVIKANFDEVNGRLQEQGEDILELQNGGYIADQQQIGAKISAWLNDHPEATTTVQDGSLTEAKFSDALKKLAIKDYLTPEMYGAVGDGITDDTEAIQDCIDDAILNRKILLGTKNYKITSTVTITTSLNLADVTSDVAYVMFTGRILCDNGRASSAFELKGYHINFYVNEIVDINCASDERDGYHGVTDKSYGAIRLANVGYFHIKFTRIVNFASAFLCDSATVTDGYIEGDSIQNCIYGFYLCQQRSVINLMTIRVGIFMYSNAFAAHLGNTKTYSIYQIIPTEPEEDVTIYGVDHIYMHRPCFSTGPSNNHTCFYFQLARNCRFDDLYVENGGSNSKFAVFDMVYPNGVYKTTTSFNNVFGFQELKQGSISQNRDIEFLNLDDNTVSMTYDIARHDYEELREIATVHAPFGEVLDLGTNNKLVKNWVFYWLNNANGATLSDNLVLETKNFVREEDDVTFINPLSPGIRLFKVADTTKRTNIMAITHGLKTNVWYMLFDSEKNILNPASVCCGARPTSLYASTVLQFAGAVKVNEPFGITVLDASVAYVGVLFANYFMDVSIYSDNAYDVSKTMITNLKYFRDKYVLGTTPRTPSAMTGNAYIGQRVYDLNNLGQYWELGANGWTKVIPS